MGYPKGTKLVYIGRTGLPNPIGISPKIGEVVTSNGPSNIRPILFTKIFEYPVDREGDLQSIRTTSFVPLSDYLAQLSASELAEFEKTFPEILEPQLA